MPRNAPRVLRGIVIALVPIALAGAAWAETIASGETKAGALATSSQTSYDFAGTAGDRVILTSSEQSGTVQPEILLFFNDTGGPVLEDSRTGNFTEHRLERVLASTGTYTVTIREAGANATGTYSLALVQIPGATTSSGDADGGTIASGANVSGSFDYQADTDVFAFDATANDRIILTLADLGGTSQPEIYLYPPSGGAAEATRAGAAASKKLDVRVAETGTYRIVVHDFGQNQEGTYALAFVKTPTGNPSGSDADGGTIASGESRTATLTPRGDLDVYAFDGAAGDRVIIATADLSTATQTEIHLYPPDGGDAEATSVGAVATHRLETRLLQTGTYTFVLHDSGMNGEGTQTVSFLKIPAVAGGADPDGGTLVPGDVVTGTLTPRADLDVFTFEGTAGDRVLVTTADLSAATQTEIYLYPPGGGALEASSVGAVSSHRLEAVLAATGTYSVVVQDNGLAGEGTYTIAVATIPGAGDQADGDGGSLIPGETRVGRLLGRADTDLWRFRADEGDRIILATSELAGAIQPEIRVYDESTGAVVAADGGAATEHRVEFVVPTTGRYTVTVADFLNDKDDGYYGISFTRFASAGSAPNDRDGGPIELDRSITATFLNQADHDCWQFYGTVGDQVTIQVARTTATGPEPEIALHPPGGGAAETSAGGSGASKRLVWQLRATGLYSIVVSEFGLNADGTYSITVNRDGPTAPLGVFRHFPPNGANVADLSERLRWDAVEGATAYDVRFGTDLLEELPILEQGTTSTSAAFPGDIVADRTYWWRVVAHTPAGDVPGPVVWFQTSPTPVVASDDFTDGDATGDRNWSVLAGRWAVDKKKRYVSTPVVNAILQDNIAVFPTIPGFVVGEISARVGVASPALRGGPNAEIMFAFSDSAHYRFVRLRPGKIEIGQAGAFAGDDDASIVKVRAKIPKTRETDVRVVVRSDGSVDVFLKRTQDAAYPAAPAATHRFKGPVGGLLGLRAVSAKSTFDDFAAIVRASVR